MGRSLELSALERGGINTGYNVYKLYVAVKAHFSGKCDIFKYKGKTKASIKSYDNRKDKYLFEKLAGKYSKKEILNFFIANFSSGDCNGGVYEITENSFDVYLDWIKKMESIKYLFGLDVDKILSINDLVADSLYVSKNNSHPVIFKLLLGKKIMLETVIILDNIYEFAYNYDKKLKLDMQWEEVSNKIKVYKPFLRFNIDNFIEIVYNKEIEKRKDSGVILIP